MTPPQGDRRMKWRMAAAIVLLMGACAPSSPKASTARSDQASEFSANSSLVSGTTTTLVTSSPLGGVSVTDPLPPEADAVSDPAGAETAVRYAYGHWILVDLDATLRGRLIENGDANATAIHNGIQASRGIADFARIAVNGVHFTGPDTADVEFRVQWHDQPSPIFPGLLSGRAVYRNGTWRMASATFCLFAFGTGQGCAGVQSGAASPTSSLHLTVAPSGYVLAGKSAGAGLTSDRIAVPGEVDWQAGLAFPRAFLSISTEVLAGLSARPRPEIDASLATGHFGTINGESRDVEDKPARAATTATADGTLNRLVVVRADDVVVTLSSNHLSIDDLARIAAGLREGEDLTPPITFPVAPVPEILAGIPPVTAVTGRPLRRRRRAHVARSRWRGRRRRPRPQMALTASDTRCLAAYWRRVASFEHASITAFEELAARLRFAGAPADLIERVLAAVDEERIHTLLASDLASRFAGRRLVRAPLLADPTFAATSVGEIARLAEESVADGMLNEGYAAWLASAQRAAADDPLTVATLGVLANDEAGHALLARDITRWCLDSGDLEVRRTVTRSLALLPTRVTVLEAWGVTERYGAFDPDPDRSGYNAVRQQVIDDVTSMLTSRA